VSLLSLVAAYCAGMELGAHLPLMDFGGNPYTIGHLTDFARAADELGFTTLAANDHLVFSVPWLDGPTALAAVIEASGDLTLATTVALPVVRGPVPLAKSLGAIDRLSGGRLVAAVGAGSSARDHEIVGLEFDERWKRLDEVIPALRAMWNGDSTVDGTYYSTSGIDLLPRPARTDGPPIWIGTWGSAAGLRRTARLADGWLASAYNTTPADFAEAWARLQALLLDHGKDPATFPNGLSTMWFHIADDRAEADRVMRERLLPTINRPEEILRERLPIGPAEAVADKIRAFADAGVQRILLWPVTDELRQLELVAERVMPLI
jgi:alkanesulfonate monooxygenase SsuD/methylene tetrahydromethanopterin reductase-like flavin-dependent oxidoreductase (luciferase family)